MHCDARARATMHWLPTEIEVRVKPASVTSVRVQTRQVDSGDGDGDGEWTPERSVRLACVCTRARAVLWSMRRRRERDTRRTPDRLRRPRREHPRTRGRLPSINQPWITRSRRGTERGGAPRNGAPSRAEPSRMKRRHGVGRRRVYFYTKISEINHASTTGYCTVLAILFALLALNPRKKAFIKSSRVRLTGATQNEGNYLEKMLRKMQMQL